MNSTLLRCGVPLFPPYFIVEPVLTGYWFELWQLIEIKFNFTSEFIYQSPLNRTGFHLDVDLTPIWPTSDFSNVTYSIPIERFQIGLIFKKLREHFSSESYIHNWSPKLWYAFIFMTVIFNLQWLLFNVMSQVHLNVSSKRKVDVIGCFLEVYAVLFSQNSFIASTKASIRIYQIVVILFMYLLQNFYSSVLLSKLTSTITELPFHSVDEIPRRAPDYTICVVNLSIGMTNFVEDTKGWKLKQEWKSIVVDNVICEIEPYDRLCVDKFCKFGAMDGFEYQYYHAPCFRSLMTLTRRTVLAGIALNRNLDRNKVSSINKGIRWLKESGLQNRHRKKWLKKTSFIDNDMNDLIQIEFVHIKVIVALYLTFAIASLLVLLMEVVYEAWKADEINKQYQFNRSMYRHKFLSINTSV